MSETILGISAYYHDSAACLLVDGRISAAVQEERFTRKKHDDSFPANAIKYVLEESGIEVENLNTVAFYDKPYLKFERLLETYHAFVPFGLKSFLSAMPVWIKKKLFFRKILSDELKKIGVREYKISFPEHHLSHAASAFYPSPFEKAAILTIDGVGEWATTTIGYGENNRITMLRELHFPHSIGLLYSAFTYYCGFKVNSGEYKLMGLAAYGNRTSERVKKWKQLVLDELVDIREDGSLLLNMAYFNFAVGLTMCHDSRWQNLFGIEKRKPESEITQPYIDMAFVIQQIAEEIIFKLAQTAKELTGCDYLTMAGGVALNSVANGKLLKKGVFKDIWVQPAAGDAGGAIGAACAVWHIGKGKQRVVNSDKDAMNGTCLGPQFYDGDIFRMAKKFNASFQHYTDFNKLCANVSEFLDNGKVVGWFQGRMEFGPRALGNRSILADPRNPEMQKKLNLKIKYREGFRPFAPSVLEEEMQDYFDLDRPSPYMLMVAPVQKKIRKPFPSNYDNMALYERLYYLRSNVPSVTHIDYSARIQSVSRKTNPRYWKLIKAFKERTGCGLVVNTSFNVRGEPIVCAPEDGYRCFMRTEMDCLVMENCLFKKTEQPAWQEKNA